MQGPLYDMYLSHNKGQGQIHPVGIAACFGRQPAE